MLTLTRKEGQTIAIENNISEGRITIKVASLRAGRVRLAIDAPDAVKILRGELIDSDTPENTDADARTSGGEGAATKAA
jgi:carbon storage regulator